MYMGLYFIVIEEKKATILSMGLISLTLNLWMAFLFSKVTKPGGNFLHGRLSTETIKE